VLKSSLTKSLLRGHLIHAAASRSMRCSALALARLWFVGHTASHLRATPVKSPLLLLRHCSPCSTLGSPAHVDEEFTRSPRHRRTTICSPLLSHMRIASEDDREDWGEEERNEARVSSPIASRRFVRPRNAISRPPWINGSDHATAVCRAATTASEPEAHSGREHGLGRPGQMRPTLVGCETH
jgi:hypothetical protein